MFTVMNYPLQAVFNFLHNSLNFHEDVAGSNKLPAREKNQSSLTWKNTLW